MIETRKIRGVVPVLVTPLMEDGSIDEQGLEQLVEFLIEKKIGGLWVLGTGSEDMNLSFEKRLKVAQIACRTNAGKVPLVLGAGFFAMDDTFEFMNKTRELEFDSYHVMPYHPLLSIDRLKWFYTNIADNCPKPLWMYTSANWAPPVTPEMLSELKGHPNITGIKFSTKNTVDMSRVIRLAEKKFQVITAVAAQFLPCLSIGSKAHTSSVGSALPEALIKIYLLFKSGKMDEAAQAQNELFEFLKSMPKGLKKDNFLGAAQEKYILSLRSICKPFTSSYYRDASDQEQKQIMKALIQFRLIPDLKLS